VLANAVRRGPIGIVGASGTGSQELSVRIHEFGGGVSQLIGTGGRDLSEKIGGLMMLDAIDMLEADEGTEVIALISKPPAPAVAEKVLARAAPAASRWLFASSAAMNRPPMKTDCSLRAAPKRRR
jgi:succinyl-CoA synthetase alpha subunit